MKRFLFIVLALGLCFTLLPSPLTAIAQDTATPQHGLLVRLGIESDSRKTVTQLYHEVVNPDDLKKGVGYFVAQTDKLGRERATAQGKSANSIATLGGTWMEYSLMVALLQRGKSPLYWQAEFKELPNNFFDVVLFTKEHGPVVLSPKTSLRERYKQADLEALALKGLFPSSKFYLLTLDKDKRHIANITRKIGAGEVKGIVALYDETNMDELFKFLDTLTIVEPDAGVLRSGRRIPKQ
jgi:hypothetical protein